MANEKESTRTQRAAPAPPDQVKLTTQQAERLAAVSGVAVAEIQGLTVAEISARLRWQIDPELLFFRRICGKVVKEDPATGGELPVAYATVEVEDTDCSFFGYFPVAARWAWYFPFRCRREVIATVKTDRCGNFCVYVPRWDIDWILRWRRERVCFPVIFERPTLADLLADLHPLPPVPPPGPDPAWLRQLDRGALLANVEQQLGRAAARKLGRALGGGGLAFGAPAGGTIDLLQAPAFGARLAPPLPAELLAVEHLVAGQAAGAAAGATRLTAEGVRSTLAARHQLAADLLQELDLRRFVGPFRRCYDVAVPEWVPIFDVPDIGFRVSQDVNGDGDLETIYSDGYFDVPWSAGNLSNVKLVASPIALAVPDCREAPGIPCGDLPEIVRAGFMPVRGDLTMYDPIAGYAVRTNRPHVSGDPADALPRPPAESPFHGTLALYGCVNVGSPATQYRILDSYSSDGVSFTPFLPVLGNPWWLTRLDPTGTVAEYLHVVPDAAGWYPIALPLGSNPNPWEPPQLLLDWNTPASGDGMHILKIELGSGGIPLSPQPATDPVAFHVDNAAPVTSMTVEYRKNGVGPFIPLTFPCPLVRRGAVPQDVELRVTFTAAASHLRDVSLAGAGCGAGDLVYTSGAPAGWFTRPPSSSNPTALVHWHQTVNDNSVAVTALFRLAASALQGAYNFNGFAGSRAFNPDGDDAGDLVTPPFQYDPLDIYVTPQFEFAVIDAD